MDKKVMNAEQRTVEKQKRLEVARAKLLDGTIGAISVDTCIFTENGYRLESGVFKHLEQFKDNPLMLVFSEITIKEIRGHIVKLSDEAKVKLRSVLRDIGKYWNEQSGKEDSISASLLGPDSVKEMVITKLKDFVFRCGAHLIDAKSTLDVPELLKRYFDTELPFESLQDKKSEFPDAITLLSLQAWAKKQGKAVLFVTKDNGCKRFCDESDYLYAVDNLTDALSLIQQRDDHLFAFCKTLEEKIVGGKYPDLIDRLEAEIEGDIYTIDWTPEADAAFYYDPELEEVELVSVSFGGVNGHPQFSVVDYRDDMLVVQIALVLEVDAICNFTFSVKDGIDHDMVAIGSSSVSKRQKVKVDALITFETPNADVPEIVGIELVYCRREIDFGAVWPDYGDEDPNEEDY